MSTDEAMPMCDDCGRLRNGEDIDYSPMQPIMGKPLGWYSGYDGELCSECITKLMGYANRSR